MKKKKVVILGGGIAGLSIAWRMSEKGIPVTILEREEQVGGLSRTNKYKNFLFDFSAHRFNSNNPKIIKRFISLVGKHCIRKIKKTYIRHWGEYITYPPKAFEVFKTMPKKILIPAVWDLFKAIIENFLRKKPKITFADWTRSMFGKTLSYHLNEKYAEKIWKRAASKLSSDWASIRIGNFKLIDFVIALFIPKMYKKVFSQSDPDKDWFYYSDVGIGYFPKQIEKKIIEGKGNVIKQSIVINVMKTDRGFEIEYLRSNKKQKINTDIVISTIPLDLLSKSLRPHPSLNVQTAVSKLQYLTVLIVNILLNKAQITDAHWIYYPEKEVVFNYLVEFKNWSLKMAPKEKTSLSANITCNPGDSLWKMSDQELIQKTVKDMISAGLIQNKDVIDGFVSRLPYAYPIYDLSYKKNIEILHQFFQQIPHLYIAGRTGSFDYSNSDVVMEKSIMLADKIVKTEF